MALCCEVQNGCCGCPVRSTVCTALCHYMLHGIFTVSFVFTIDCYPPFSYIDFMLGGSAAALFCCSFLTACAVDLKRCQFIRIVLGFLTTAAVLSTVTSTFYYTILRWNDVMVTAISRSIRKPSVRDFPDELWFATTCFMCIETPVFLMYLIYIVSFMFNPWRSFLFTSPYQNNRAVSGMTPSRSFMTNVYSGKDYRPYPLQVMK